MTIDTFPGALAFPHSHETRMVQVALVRPSKEGTLGHPGGSGNTIMERVRSVFEHN